MITQVCLKSGRRRRAVGGGAVRRRKTDEERTRDLVRRIGGLVGMDDSTFSDLELGEAVEAISRQVEIILQNAQRYEAVEKLRENLRLIMDINRAISSTLGLKEVAQRILESALRATGASMGTLQLVDDASQKLAVFAAVGVASDKQDVRLGKGEGIAGLSWERGTSLLVDDVTEPPWRDHFVEVMEEDIRSELVVLLRKEEQILGVISLESPKARAFTEDHMALLETLAGQAVIAIQNAQRHEELLEAERWAYLGTIVGQLAHRIGNKVGMIRLCAHELSEQLDLSDERIEENLSFIRNNAEYILELSDLLLKPSQAAGAARVYLDVNLLLGSAVKQANIPAHIRVETRLGEGLPKVCASKPLVEVFVELITNAITAISGEGRLEIESSARGARWVEVQFADTGCGIAPEHVDRVFDPFFSAWEEEEQTVRDRRYGFGLWWIKTYLAGIGGDIVLESTEIGEGSTFMVKLPTEAPDAF